MTQEQFEILNKFEDRFTTATMDNILGNSYYVRPISKHKRNKIWDIYKELYPDSNVNCISCYGGYKKVMNTIGKAYFEYKDNISLSKTSSILDEQDIDIDIDNTVEVLKPRKNKKLKEDTQ